VLLSLEHLIQNEFHKATHTMRVLSYVLNPQQKHKKAKKLKINYSRKSEEKYNIPQTTNTVWSGEEFSSL